MKPAFGSNCRISPIIWVAAIWLCAATFEVQNPVVRWLFPRQAMAAAPTADLKSFAPQGMVPDGPPGTYVSQTLYEKINGQAELYLSAGFRELRWQLFTVTHTNQQWIEAFVYRMDSVPSAFSVFSTQRRSDGRSLDLGVPAYVTENGVYAVAGVYYLELVASDGGARNLDLMVEYTRGFLAQVPETETRLSGKELFPKQDLVAGSITLIATDAFGLAGFDRVFAARYRLGEAELSAFIARRDDPAAAGGIAQRYLNFLKEYEGRAIPHGLTGEGIEAVEIMDTYEVFFVRGNYFAGVREAAGAARAEALAERLWHRLAAAAVIE